MAQPRRGGFQDRAHYFLVVEAAQAHPAHEPGHHTPPLPPDPGIMSRRDAACQGRQEWSDECPRSQRTCPTAGARSSTIPQWWTDLSAREVGGPVPATTPVTSVIR